ncbi:methylated-DNA--[protein]-cysteine S-methyltransferase [Algibacillus agarilyticus]|uniref:methylated-DNA--[protein]-cysteine S-methyltransferase n=1 Tax=Algibacillus agarilyticus TaxID=2234133 RepID=UPI000DD00B7D|nr:methylated-DNA--[protein]-cysteine S-methyltransferase [Algibacillus agarilyticus]
MNVIAQALLETPLGRIAIFNDTDYVTGVDIFSGDINYKIANANALTVRTIDALAHYFDHGVFPQALPLAMQGTEFQNKVWQLMCQIPSGECWTYGMMAKVLESSPRAIGGACRRNPIPIIVPCHRVVAAQGIGGYSGQWKSGRRIDVKQWLLAHEKQHADLGNELNLQLEM